MKITIIAVGKLKERYWKDASAEYSKRLGRYCKLQIKEVEDEKTPDNCSEHEITLIKAKEGKRIGKYLPVDSYVIALAIGGKRMDSVELSHKIKDLTVNGRSHIVFIIGGSLGLDMELLDRSDYLLSFSELTFPHQLMRVMLLEQIYRSFKIQQNEPYHK